MTGEELFEIWAPDESVWSQWVSPVPFAQITCSETDAPRPTAVELDLQGFPNTAENAVVVDLPGGFAIRAGLGLSKCGCRPVPIMNASPAPYATGINVSSNVWSQSVVLDMTGVVQEICGGAHGLQKLTLSAKAPPVFILDSLRLKGTRPVREYMFDNRWMVFPQDFPSGKFLSDQGIKRAILIQEKKGQPQEDLAHVLLRWQQVGIDICVYAEGDIEKIKVTAPLRFKASWYRALAILGLHRNSAGGFGSIVPAASGG